MERNGNEFKYRCLLTRLHHAIEDGLGDSEAADKIREEMDAPWQAMTPEQQAKSNYHSVYLYFLADFNKAIKDKTFDGTEISTFLYAVRSHIRGKIHMKWWKKYHGGGHEVTRNPARCNDVRAYRTNADGSTNHEVTGFLIEDLVDQKDWIMSKLAGFKSTRSFNARYKSQALVISEKLEANIKFLMEHDNER
jgi:hypothetical protein